MIKIYLTIFLSVSVFLAKSQSGVLDKTFGDKGTIKTVLTGNGNTSSTKAIKTFVQADGRLLIVLEVNAAVMISRRFSDGATDSSYGTNGFSVPVDINQPASAMQSDGKIIIGGSTAYAKSNFILARFNTNGSLDASFGKSGFAITDAGSDNDMLMALVIKSNGKIVTGGQSFRNNISQFALIQYNSNGVPDPGFGTNGIVITDFGNSCNITTLALQNDNEIVAAGNYFNGTTNDYAVARYKTNGTLDSSFNGTGLVTSDFGFFDNAQSAAIQSDGKIVVGGYYTDPSIGGHFELARYTTQGALDNSFNMTGFILTNYGYPAEYLAGVGIQKNGKIIAGGYFDDNNGIQNLAIEGFNLNGSIDSSFGINGFVSTGFSTWDVGNFLTIAGNGNILTGGYSFGTVNVEFTVAQFKSNGSLVNNFGDGGKLMGYYPGKDITYPYMMVQADGKLIANAQTWDGTTSNNYLCRFSANGTPDLNYGVKGFAPTNGYYSVMQTDGKIVEATYQNTTTGTEILMSRYGSDGKPDLTYGSNGTSIADFFDGSDGVGGAAIQKDNKVVVAGFINNSVGTDLLISRFNIDGSPDVGFGTGGAIVNDIEPFDFPQSIAIGNDGKIVVGGYGFTPSFQIVLTLSLYKSDGTPDSSFAQNGKIVIMNGVQEFTGSVAFQNDGKILLGTEVSFDYSTFLSYITRFNIDGTPDMSFGQNGTIATNGSTIILGKDQKIIAGGFIINQQNNRDFALSRFLSNGKPDLSFGNAGTTITNFTAGDDILTSMAITGSSIYISGYAEDPNAIGLLAKYRLLSPSIAFAELTNVTLPTDNYSCSATLNNNFSPAVNEDPEIYKGFRYTLEGVTQGNGNGSVSGHIFNKGLTKVNYALQEDSSQTGSFTVTVEDQEAPVIGTITTQIMNTSPSARFADVILNYSSSDNCTLASNQLSVSGEEVMQSGFGKNSADWEIVNDHHVRLSAESLSGGFERRYAIQITSIDASGNRTSKNVFVQIPAIDQQDFVISASPNPSNSSFNITNKSGAVSDAVSFKLLNAQGVILESVAHVLPGQTVHLGIGLQPGVYYLEATKANALKTIKLVKM